MDSFWILIGIQVDILIHKKEQETNYDGLDGVLTPFCYTLILPDLAIAVADSYKQRVFMCVLKQDQ